MECETLRYGQYYVEAIPMASRRRGAKRKLGCPVVGHLQLDVAPALPGAGPAQPLHVDVVPDHAPPTNNQRETHHLPDLPFMSNMDEISYWIYTKRAPCLLNYDNIFRQGGEESSLSKPMPFIADEGPSPKKKKTRLSLLDDDAKSKSRQNIYFEASQQNQRTVMSSCKSDTLDSDIDFNIKKSSIQDKPKKLQKSSLTTLHKKNKVVTSTPKASTVLRRSLRKAQTTLKNNNNSLLNISFDTLNTTIVNGNHRSDMKCDQKKTPDKLQKFPVKLADGDCNDCKKPDTETDKVKKPLQNGQFEDLSDVSGFTANYIRSTKLLSAKTPRNLRNKGGRNLVKKSRQLKKDDGTMLVCVSRSMNTTDVPKTPILNCSTDSSQNVINLITRGKNDTCKRIDKSTSLLKFMESKTPKIRESGTSKLGKLDDCRKQVSKTSLSFLSKSSSTPRYPKRHRNTSREDISGVSTQLNSPDIKRRVSIKNLNEFSSSDRKENPEEIPKYRTRSGRNIGLKLQQPDNSVLVMSNSTEPVTPVAMNVAVPDLEDQSRDNIKKKKCVSCVKYVSHEKQSIEKSGQSLRRDSLRDRSGFAACFSDSDDGSDPLKPRKFFC